MCNADASWHMKGVGQLIHPLSPNRCGPTSSCPPEDWSSYRERRCALSRTVTQQFGKSMSREDA